MHVVRCTGRQLILVGTLADVNTFRVSATDLQIVSDIVIRLPAFEAAVNASIKNGTAPPKTSVIINVLYESDYTGFGVDPSGTPDSARVPATTVSLDSFGISGLFDVEVSVCVSACVVGVVLGHVVGAQTRISLSYLHVMPRY